MKYLTIFFNWRINVLVLTGLLALLLICSDADTLRLTLYYKAAGLALGLFTYRLGAHWNRHGKIDELMDLVNEE